MAYQMKDLSGSLFVNENKNPQDANDRRPHYKGKVMINGQIYFVSAWWTTKEGIQPFFSLKFELPRAQTQQYAPAQPQQYAPAQPQYVPQAPAQPQYQQVQSYQQATQPQAPRGGMPPQYQQQPPRYQQPAAPAQPQNESLNPQPDDLPFD